MKRIYSRIMTGLGLFIFLFFIGGEIYFWSGLTFVQQINLISVGIIIPYITFSTKIEYFEDYMYFYAGWNKVKISFYDITRIYSAANPFGYWLHSYDTRERKFILAFPLEHKKLGELFDAITRVNPKVQINVWWYKKQAASNNLKTVLKVVLFIIAIFAADFLFHFFIKR